MLNFSAKKMSIFKNKTGFFLILPFLYCLNISPGFCDTWEVKDLLIDHAYAFAAMSGKNGAAYFHIVNQGNSADDLIGVKSPISEKTTLHQSVHENGIMKMRSVSSIAIPANSKVFLKPGDYHVMLFGLKKPLRAGEQFPMRVIFKKSGSAEILVRIFKMKTGDHE